MSQYDRSELFVCDCSDAAHNIIFQLWDWGKNEKRLTYPAESNFEMCVHVNMEYNHTFWKRIWLAIKYIFGYRSKYGFYDVMTIRYADIPRLQALMTEYLEKIEGYKKKLEEQEKAKNGE